MKKDFSTSQKREKKTLSHGKHEQNVDEHIQHALKLLKVKGVTWRPMSGRTVPVNTAKDYSLGYTDIQNRMITIDIYTPKFRKPKSMNGILRVLAHEVGHIQKPPYRQKHRGKWITRMHYPSFYDRVNKNVDRFKKDKLLKQYFRK